MLSDQAVLSSKATSDLRVPPHSTEAEQAVLGGLLLDPEAWDQVADKIVAAHFYRREHQLIYKAMQALVSADQSQPIDALTVTEYLEKNQQLESVGGMAYVAGLARNIPSSANIRAYSDIVYERSVLRQLMGLGSKLAESAFTPGGRSSAELLDELEQEIFSLAEHGLRQGGPEGIRLVVARALDQIQQRYENPNVASGISTGFHELDRMTSGLQAGELVIIAARPSMGKTSFAMNIAEHAAIKSGKAVLVFSMEMPAQDLATRLLSSLGRIDQHRLRQGSLIEEDWPRLTAAVGLLSEAKLYIDETPSLSPIELRTRARRVATEKDGLGLIVVDYLQLMRVQNSENRAVEISEISRSLKALAKELKVPVIALSQLNRDLEKRPNRRPVMSDLRESGAIEQDADLIAFIYRDEVYNEDSADKGTAEIIIGKQRNGPTGTMRLTFLGHFTRFENFISERTFGPD